MLAAAKPLEQQRKYGSRPLKPQTAFPFSKGVGHFSRAVLSTLLTQRQGVCNQGQLVSSGGTGEAWTPRSGLLASRPPRPVMSVCPQRAWGPQSHPKSCHLEFAQSSVRLPQVFSESYFPGCKHRALKEGGSFSLPS